MSKSMATPNLSSLAGLPDDALIDVHTLARLMDCSTRHVWRLAACEELPAPLSIGRLKRWRIGTIRGWMRDGCPVTRPN